MNNLGIFLRAQGANIITVVILFLSLLTLFSILKVDFNPIVNKHVQKVVTVVSPSKTAILLRVCACNTRTNRTRYIRNVGSFQRRLAIYQVVVSG